MQIEGSPIGQVQLLCESSSLLIMKLWN